MLLLDEPTNHLDWSAIEWLSSYLYGQKKMALLLVTGIGVAYWAEAAGTPILAAAPGRVSFVGVKSGYGKVVEVDHGQGIMTRYAHLSGFTSQVGTQVAAGQQIAKMGSTGRSTGSHLHFEVRLNGVAVNPRRFLEAKADVLEVKNDARQRVGSVAAARGAR